MIDVVITEWALRSYIDLKHQRVFADREYKTILRPDAEKLKDGFPSPHPEFQNAKFWSVAAVAGTPPVQYGFKMKWHNLGPGKIQLRLMVALFGNAAFLCQAYVKVGKSSDVREIAKLKNHIRDIALGKYVHRGNL